MKIFKLFFRDEQIASVDAVELWEVRWTRRYGEYSSNTEPCVRVFTSEKDAEILAKALEDAFILIQHTSGNDIYIKKQSN